LEQGDRQEDENQNHWSKRTPSENGGLDLKTIEVYCVLLLRMLAPYSTWIGPLLISWSVIAVWTLS
jgi:hypothetical protein